jgi:hypothetical protein
MRTLAEVVAVGEVSSTKAAWRDWADGRWRRIPGLGDEPAQLLRFRNRLYSWCGRNGYRGESSLEMSGDVLFRIVRKAAP